MLNLRFKRCILAQTSNRNSSESHVDYEPGRTNPPSLQKKAEDTANQLRKPFEYHSRTSKKSLRIKVRGTRRKRGMSLRDRRMELVSCQRNLPLQESTKILPSGLTKKKSDVHVCKLKK